MKRKPQIFDRLQKQKEPVPPEMLDILKSDEGTMKGIMEQWRTHLKEYDERSKALAQDVRDASLWDRTDDIGNIKSQKDAYKRNVRLGRPLKKLFAKHADRAFLDSLVTIHYTVGVEELIELLKDSVLENISRDELSTFAYLPGEVDMSDWGNYALVIKGHITLLANSMDNVISGAGQLYQQTFPKRTRMSGANKGVGVMTHPDIYESGDVLVLDRESWNPFKGYTGESPTRNEALVDNWKPSGVVVLPNKVDVFKTIVRRLELDIPVMTFDEAVKML